MPPRFVSALPAPLPLRDGVRVLEIGTGDGNTILQVATWASELGVRGSFVGLDREPSRAQPFAERAEAAGVGDTTRFACENAFRIPPSLGPFDVLLCFECLSQFIFEAQPSDGTTVDAVRDGVTSLFTHWRTLVSPGGVLVIAETDRDAAGDANARGIALFEQERWPLLPSAVIDEALRAAGFDALLTRSSVLQSGERDKLERWMGSGPYRRMPRREWPPTPFPPRVPQAAEGAYEINWRVVQASLR